MQTSAQPFIELTFERMFCGIHGEPFREQWPRGAVIFQLKAFTILVEDATFWEELERRFGLDVDASDEQRHERMGKMFDVRPLCCRLGDKLVDVYVWQYENKGIGVPGFCCNPHCGSFALGAPFKQKLPDGRVDRIPHICFRCVAFNIAPRAN